MARRPDTFETALAKVFEGPRRREASWLSVTGGETLITAGQPADTVYLLRSGRLGVFKPAQEGAPPRFIGLIKPGEPAGEISILAGTAHTSTVVALRDSEVLALSREVFLSALKDRSELTVELARLMIGRLRSEGQASSRPSVFGFVAARARPIRAFVERIGEHARMLGFSCAVVADFAPPEALDALERDHDVVLYVAEADETGWATFCARQADRLFLCGSAAEPPPHHPVQRARSAEARRLTDLILFRNGPGGPPATSARWIDALDPARWFHVHEAQDEDVARVARVVTGTSVGLVLSGGGARAYAHVGALRAFRAAGAQFDFAGGVSMGAVIAAEVSAGIPQDEMEARLRHAFVDTSPLSDLSMPIIAMTRGHKVDRLLEQAYGQRRMADLPLPFFCVSADLTSGHPHLHDRGPLAQALRASIALPGILPPVVLGDRVLVDGAVMRNLPAEIMRDVNEGPVVAIDVTRDRAVDPHVLADPPSWWRWLLSGEWKKGPPLVSILMRSATVTTGADLASSRAATDLLVLPHLDGVEIRDWKAWQPAVAAGESAAVAAMATLDGPLTHLRQRKLAAVPDLTGETDIASS
ncbi:patatin-like phospholipase family protein [Brevundimonas lutea]|uniref:patatin-like phospholipase family protein n=1 Tax=Brevundimonas lutea TaxID=2293980 RepID=UPI000F01CB50|nr:patatin-like phospholipase family protein [Brevundimonas lutea]